MSRFLSRIRGLFIDRCTGAESGAAILPSFPSSYRIDGGRAGSPAALSAIAATMPGCMNAYLRCMGNTPEDILTTAWLLSYPRIIVEIGCGSGDIAREVALNNPDIGVLATDLYQWDESDRANDTGYRKTAQAWRQRRLPAQKNRPENLVLLRAEVNFMRYLPEHRVDTVLMINPEPKVGSIVLNTLARPERYRGLKPGPRQIVVLPFSREMGIYACGGWQFDHEEDYSRGLGFMMGSAFTFAPVEPILWGVDLQRASCYSRHSTQCTVYATGMLNSASGHHPD